MIVFVDSAFYLFPFIPMSAFLTVAVIHLLGVASPGPDFAIIVQKSLSQPRKVVLWTALGIGLGILVHVAYSLLGIGIVIARSVVLFSTIKLLGAAYLIFIGWKAMRAKPSNVVGEAAATRAPAMPPFEAFRVGFLCNVLNPKATLFFLALFTQVIDPGTPAALQLFYGLYMSVATFLWFSMLGSVLTMRRIRSSFEAVHHWAERAMGAALIALGVKVAISTRD